MELMSSFTDTKFIHIRYRGGGPALNDALAGHVPVSMLNIVQALPHVQAGRIIPLAVTDFTEAIGKPSERSFTRRNIPGYEADLWYHARWFQAN